MDNLFSLIAMLISEVLIILMFVMIIRSNGKSQLKYAFEWLLFFMFIWTLGSVLQIIFQSSSIEPIVFEMISGMGVFFAPVAFLAIGLIFAKTKIVVRWYHYLLLIIPIISEVLLVTNSLHHLFFIKYSAHVEGMVYGPYFYVHSLYTYALFGIGIIYFLRYSIKNSGFFSKQSALIIISTIIPILTNLLATFQVFSMTTYSTPISFTLMILIIALAIFKFDLMKLTPIALQRIVDSMSDGYMVIDEQNIISDFNTTLLNMFGLNPNYLRNRSLYSVIKDNNFLNVDIKNLKDCIEKSIKDGKTYTFSRKLDKTSRYFNIEINSIRNNGTYLGTLILFKDVTQHMLDLQTIKSNQDMLMEKERLASLGQLIGGIAHNLKTPIMSISGAAEGLTDLINEYDESIDDPQVTPQDHHDIAKDMRTWIAKIRSYTEYMSDVITAVKGQAVNMSDDQNYSFTIDELVKRIDILMKHELKSALVNLNLSINVDPLTVLSGNINSLVQVINNMISNSIQAYHGEPNKSIDLIVEEKDKKVIISVRDYGTGLSKEVQDKLFKEMVTTKGKNGTGLGLFMSYSTIRAHFNGNITFDTKEGEGTTFHIILPKNN